MFSAELYQRANSKKASLYSIFQTAVEAVALFDDDYSPAEKLAKLVVRAEAFLFDSPDPARFKASIIYAFERSRFQGLYETGRRNSKATAAEDLRRLAFPIIGPQKIVLDRGGEAPDEMSESRRNATRGTAAAARSNRDRVPQQRRLEV